MPHQQSLINHSVNGNNNGNLKKKNYYSRTTFCSHIIYAKSINTDRRTDGWIDGQTGRQESRQSAWQTTNNFSLGFHRLFLPLSEKWQKICNETAVELFFEIIINI